MHEKRSYLPVVLSRSEMEAIIDSTSNLKHKAMIALMLDIFIIGSYLNIRQNAVLCSDYRFLYRGVSLPAANQNLKLRYYFPLICKEFICEVKILRPWFLFFNDDLISNFSRLSIENINSV